MIKHTCTGYLKVTKRRTSKFQRSVNRLLAKLPRGLSRGRQLRGRIVSETGWQPNLILNAGISSGVFTSLGTTEYFRTYTDGTPNFRDVTGTWSQSGNIVTRVSGSDEFETTDVGNELKWEDGERCHVVTRNSATEIVVSGPSRTISNKEIKIYRTNLTAISGSVQSAQADAGDTTTSEDITAGTWERELSIVLPGAASAYTLQSVKITGSGSTSAEARVVLSAPVDVEEDDQLEMSYKQQITVSGREAHVVPLSEIVNGYPYRFQTDSITGDGTTLTIVTGEDHNFLAGDRLVIDGAVPLRHVITGITANGTAWTVTAPSHGVSPSDTIVIENCTVVDYNGTWTVATTPDGNTLTITNAAEPGTASDGTVRLSTPATYFNGEWEVSDVPDSTTIEILTDRTGPVIDPAAVTTSPDEATVSYWGNFANSLSTTVFRGAVNETNKIERPAVDWDNGVSATFAHGSMGVSSTAGNLTGITSNSDYSNDFVTSIATPSADNWSAGGSDELRFAQVAMLRNRAGSSNSSDVVQGMLIEFATPQPKLATHRFQYPTMYRKFTRDLPDY